MEVLGTQTPALVVPSSDIQASIASYTNGCSYFMKRFCDAQLELAVAALSITHK